MKIPQMARSASRLREPLTMPLTAVPATTQPSSPITVWTITMTVVTSATDGGLLKPSRACAMSGARAQIGAHQSKMSSTPIRSRNGEGALPPELSADAPSRMSISPLARLPLAVWVDVDLRPGTRACGSLAGEHASDLLEIDRRRDQRPRVDGPVGVRLDGRGQTGRSGQDAYRGDVLEGQSAGVDHARGPGQSDVDHPTRRLDEVQRQRRELRGVRGIDHCVERQGWQGGLRPRLLEAQRPSEVERAVGHAEQMHLCPGGPGEHRDEQADRARPEDQGAVVGAEVRGLRRAESVAARFHQRAEL